MSRFYVQVTLGGTVIDSEGFDEDDPHDRSFASAFAFDSLRAALGFGGVSMGDEEDLTGEVAPISISIARESDDDGDCNWRRPRPSRGRARQRTLGLDPDSAGRRAS